MNINNIKKMAPKACELFHHVTERRLKVLGISVDNDGEIEITEADASFIKLDSESRDKLIQSAQTVGYKRLIEQASYTWFNRLCAIRYMEIHNFLGHEQRVLSHPENSNGFEILDHAQNLADDLGLNQEHIIELKLAGNKEDELFRYLLLGQCHSLHEAMPFLFDTQNSELDLLLPDNLTRSDSVVRLIVNELSESDWQSLDIFSVLFEFYYSKYKKGLPKKVELSSLPALTQVCEPKWVSQFMLENTLARRWKELNPDSTIDEGLDYYLPSVKQSESVIAQLSKISSNIQESPEEVRVLDPACGSGTNLLHAYDLLLKIYQEKGYRLRDIPSLIFSKNLFGLDMDERACQVSSLVLMLKGREDDRRFFTRGITPFVTNLSQTTLTSTINDELTVKSNEVGYLFPFKEELSSEDINDNLNEQTINAKLVFGNKYDVIVCYPPNMGILKTGETLVSLKALASSLYSNTKSNLATMFLERSLGLLKPNGFSSFILKDSWLFMARYEKMRAVIFKQNTIQCMAHLGRNVIPGKHRMNTLVLRNAVLPDYEAQYCLTETFDIITLSSGNQIQLPAPKVFPVDNERLKTNSLSQMGIVPTQPVSYWVNPEIQLAFSLGQSFKKTVDIEPNGKNISRDKYVRQWSELELSRFDFDDDSDNDQMEFWPQLLTGGSFRRWYGNLDLFVHPTQIKSKQLLNKEANTWPSLAFIFNARIAPKGSVFDASGPCCSKMSDPETRYFLLGLMNSKLFDELVHVMFPEGMLGAIRPKEMAQLPIVDTDKSEISSLVEQLVQKAKDDWHSVETSWGFNTIPWLDDKHNFQSNKLNERYQILEKLGKKFVTDVYTLENNLNHRVSQSYLISDGVIPDVSKVELSYYNNPYFQNDNDDGLPQENYDKTIWNKFRSRQVKALLSYGVGCILGRYSVKKAGVTYAGSDNLYFDEAHDNNQASDQFIPDSDGIVPLSNISRFKDDLADQLRLWLKMTFGSEHIVNNLQFIAESLLFGGLRYKSGESTFETLQRYLVNQFYQYHVATYQHKPIYWLFSSGGNKAFECLVYLHRYNESTLSRMRTEYVTPLLGQYSANEDVLKGQLENVTSFNEEKQIKNQLYSLQNMQSELRHFDDDLKHYADQLIKLDLEDGVKVNYAKFGPLLADSKNIT